MKSYNNILLPVLKVDSILKITELLWMENT